MASSDKLAMVSAFCSLLFYTLEDAAVEKKWITPEIEELDLGKTSSGWNAWKLDFNWEGLPLVGEDPENS